MSYMNSPRAHWLQIHRTNPPERLDVEIKRHHQIKNVERGQIGLMPLREKHSGGNINRGKCVQVSRLGKSLAENSSAEFFATAFT